LHHYRQESQPPSGSQTFVIPTYEESWQHTDGTSANRQQLLMALANVTAIYIKATYTTVAEEAGLSQVELDYGTEQNFGSGARASEVEDCQCPVGHQGTSCEDCSPGFFKGDEGLYLGLCEPCNCNGHSDECDSKTGICKNCRGNTYGDNCELCMPGFYGNATSGGCTPGSSDSRRDCRNCDPSGTASCNTRSGICNCKPNVVGDSCNQCREGAFGLSESNNLGCHECFCSGATTSCAAGDFYREEIPVFFSDVINQIKITDREGRNELPAEFEENIIENSVTYRFNDDSSIFYWNLPNRLTGNLILSYGGNLEVKLKTDGSGAYTPDQDVIIKGNNVVLFYTRDNYEEETYKVPLIESSWKTQNRGGPRPATRSELLTVLSDVESILIRASLRSYTSESTISDIILDTAVRQPTSTGKVNDIEVCRCPPGYRGTSCEQCDSLYYRDVNDRSAGMTGTCKICPCENTESCELGSSRRVQCRCLPGWGGETCRDRIGE
jgi:Laminin B (Domain IV)/Laminin EGF domain